MNCGLFEIADEPVQQLRPYDVERGEKADGRGGLVETSLLGQGYTHSMIHEDRYEEGK